MSKQAALNRREKRGLNAQRRARTRTLIQLGGLLKVAGLLEVFGIEEGEDLQLSPEGQEKAYALLGWVQGCLETKGILEPAQVESCKRDGKRLLKIHQARYYH